MSKVPKIFIFIIRLERNRKKGKGTKTEIGGYPTLITNEEEEGKGEKVIIAVRIVQTLLASKERWRKRKERGRGLFAQLTILFWSLPLKERRRKK